MGCHQGLPAQQCGHPQRDPRPVPCSAACAITRATSFTARSDTPPPRVARSPQHRREVAPLVDVGNVQLNPGLGTAPTGDTSKRVVTELEAGLTEPPTRLLPTTHCPQQRGSNSCALVPTPMPRHRPTRQRHALHAAQMAIIDLPCEASSSRQGARDNVALYFAGSLTDFQNFRVRIKAGDARLQDVAVTTVNLQTLACGPVGDL